MTFMQAAITLTRCGLPNSPGRSRGSRRDLRRRHRPPLIDMLDGNPRVQGGMKQLHLKVNRSERQKVTEEEGSQKAKKESVVF